MKSLSNIQLLEFPENLDVTFTYQEKAQGSQNIKSFYLDFVRKRIHKTCCNFITKEDAYFQLVLSTLKYRFFLIFENVI